MHSKMLALFENSIDQEIFINLTTSCSRSRASGTVWDITSGPSSTAPVGFPFFTKSSRLDIVGSRNESLNFKIRIQSCTVFSSTTNPKTTHRHQKSAPFWTRMCIKKARVDLTGGVTRSSVQTNPTSGQPSLATASIQPTMTLKTL